MDLARAIGVKPGQSIAFVGAGGKSTTMFALAEENIGQVIITTTTHLGSWQAKFANVHYIVDKKNGFHQGIISNGSKILVTGPEGDDDRLHGLDGESFDKLQDLCKKKKITLLIEADGARQRALKAPADYEPVIPDGVDIVVVLVGLSALGKPLDESWVHRPKIFSSITGLKENQEISEKDVITLMRSSKGGLKGIPKECQKILFLNQADDDKFSSIGGRIANGSKGTYDRVMIGSMLKPEDSGYIQSVYSQTAGIILAAGGSERLEKPKQLLDWQGKAFVQQVAETALEAGVQPLIVVTGAYYERVTASLRGLPVKTVHNFDWQKGQSTSVKLGLSSLPDECDNAMFLLSDQPQIPSQLLIELMEHFYQNRKPITAPMVNGQRGNPMLFSREVFPSLMNVSGDRGGRAVIQQFDVDWMPWVDSRILLDVDKAGDYEKLKRAYGISLL